MSVYGYARISTARDFNGSLVDRDVMKLCGLSRNTYYKYKREIAVYPFAL